jgi:hypothetical protein
MFITFQAQASMLRSVSQHAKKGFQAQACYNSEASFLNFTEQQS